MSRGHTAPMRLFLCFVMFLFAACSIRKDLVPEEFQKPEHELHVSLPADAGGLVVMVNEHEAGLEPVKLRSEDTYAIEITAQPSCPTRACRLVVDGVDSGTVVTGTVDRNDIFVSVSCKSMTGIVALDVVELAGADSVGVKLVQSCDQAWESETALVEVSLANGRYTHSLPVGMAYRWEVTRMPLHPKQSCAVFENDRMGVVQSDRQIAALTCMTDRVPLTVMVSGVPAGSTADVWNNDAAPTAVGDGVHELVELAEGETYAVRVDGGDALDCDVTNPDGTVVLDGDDELVAPTVEITCRRRFVIVRLADDLGDLPAPEQITFRYFGASPLILDCSYSELRVDCRLPAEADLDDPAHYALTHTPHLECRLTTPVAPGDPAIISCTRLVRMTLQSQNAVTVSITGRTGECTNEQSSGGTRFINPNVTCSPWRIPVGEQVTLADLMFNPDDLACNDTDNDADFALRCYGESTFTVTGFDGPLVFGGCVENNAGAWVPPVTPAGMPLQADLDCPTRCTQVDAQCREYCDVGAGGQCRVRGDNPVLDEPRGFQCAQQGSRIVCGTRPVASYQVTLHGHLPGTTVEGQECEEAQIDSITGVCTVRLNYVPEAESLAVAPHRWACASELGIPTCRRITYTLTITTNYREGGAQASLAVGGTPGLLPAGTLTFEVSRGVSAQLIEPTGVRCRPSLPADSDPASGELSVALECGRACNMAANSNIDLLWRLDQTSAWSVVPEVIPAMIGDTLSFEGAAGQRCDNVSLPLGVPTIATECAMGFTRTIECEAQGHLKVTVVGLQRDYNETLAVSVSGCSGALTANIPGFAGSVSGGLFLGDGTASCSLQSNEAFDASVVTAPSHKQCTVSWERTSATVTCTPLVESPFGVHLTWNTYVDEASGAMPCTSAGRCLHVGEHLQAVFKGARCVDMSPAPFFSRPVFAAACEDTGTNERPIARVFTRQLASGKALGNLIDFAALSWKDITLSVTTLNWSYLIPVTWTNPIELLTTNTNTLTIPDAPSTVFVLADRLTLTQIQSPESAMLVMAPGVLVTRTNAQNILWHPNDGGPLWLSGMFADAGTDGACAGAPKFLLKFEKQVALTLDHLTIWSGCEGAETWNSDYARVRSLTASRGRHRGTAFKIRETDGVTVDGLHSESYRVGLDAEGSEHRFSRISALDSDEAGIVIHSVATTLTDSWSHDAGYFGRPNLLRTGLTLAGDNNTVARFTSIGCLRGIVMSGEGNLLLNVTTHGLIVGLRMEDASAARVVNSAISGPNGNSVHITDDGDAVFQDVALIQSSEALPGVGPLVSSCTIDWNNGALENHNGDCSSAARASNLAFVGSPAELALVAEEAVDLAMATHVQAWIPVPAHLGHHILWDVTPRPGGWLACYLPTAVSDDPDVLPYLGSVQGDRDSCEPDVASEVSVAAAQ